MSKAEEPRSATPRRFFISMAVDEYLDAQAESRLTRPSTDARLLAELLSSSGYQQVLQGMGNYWTADHVRTSLSDWSKHVGLGPDDVVVFYFAGHGLVADRDRHYLMCWNSSEDDPAATALATEDVLRILTRSGLRNLLMVLDTCYGGVAAADGAQVALRTIARQASHTETTGVWLLSSARAKEEAIDGAFMDSLVPAVREVGERSGQRQRHLDLVHIVDATNAHLQRAGLRQRAELAAGMVTGLAPFLDNEHYCADLPVEDTDLELQRRLANPDLRDHFGPRSRGVEFDSEPGMYFHGRARLLEELVQWLTNPRTDGRGRIVTGSPGCGKSAVLGRIVALSDPAYRPRVLREADVAEVPPKLVDVAVHSRHKLLPEIVRQIATELEMDVDGPGQLLRDLSVRAREGRPIVIVVDALDEAGSGTAADAGGRGEPRRIARELLRPLSEVPGVRLLIGTRRELVSSLGAAMEVLDLDDRKYLGHNDIAGYVTSVLLARNEPDVPTPYRDQPELARQVGEAVERRAAGVFLVARMTARGLRTMSAPVDVHEQGWQDKLPSEIGEAFDDYLSQFREDEDRVRALLTPLAFAEGQGLPRGAIWMGISTALGSRRFDEEDIDWLLDKAAAYIAEITEHGRSVYRLYHQALAEHLRENYRPGQRVAQNHIVDALHATVLRDSQDLPDWFSAHRYLQNHLATHAAAAGRLDELVGDPRFLLFAEQLALLQSFRQVRSEKARQARNAYEQVAHQLTDLVPVAERAAYLQLSARRCGAQELADKVDRLNLPVPWQTRWAWWSPTGVHRQLVGHEKEIEGLATGNMDGRPILLTGSADGTARIWDLITQRSIGEPIKPGSKSITALAVGEMEDYTIAVTGGNDGRLLVWDLSSGKPLCESLVGHTNAITSIVLGDWANKTVAVTGSSDGTARVWDIGSGVQLGEPFTGHRRPVNGVAWTDLDGRRVVLTGGADNRVRVWDIETMVPVGEPLIGHTKPITAVGLTLVNDKPLVLTGSSDGTLGLWDLLTRQQVGEPLAADQQGVNSLAVGELNGVPIAVSSGRHIARVWNLTTRQQIGQPLTGHDGFIHAVALGALDNTVAVTGGADRTVRIWDLTAEQPLAGHTGQVVSAAMALISGRHFALTGSTDTTAVVWDLDAGGKQDGQSLPGHRATVSAVALGEIGQRPVAVTADEDAVVLIWDLVTRQRIGSPLVGHTGPVAVIRLCHVDSRQVLATGSKDGTVRLWDPVTGKALFAPLTGHNGDVDLLAIDERGLVLAATHGGHVTAWDLPSQSRQPIKPPNLDQWTALTVGFVDGQTIGLFTGAGGTMMLWDLVSGHAVGSAMVGHTDVVNSAILSQSDGVPIALSASRDDTIIAWNLRSCRPLGPAFENDHRFRNFTMCAGKLSSDTAAIAVGGDQLRQLSLTTFHQVGDALHGSSRDVFCLANGVVEGRRVLIAAGEDGTVRVLDAVSGQLSGPVMNGHQAFLGGVGFAEVDGPVAVTIGQFENGVRVWDLVTRRLRSQWTSQETARVAYSGVRLLATSERRGQPIVATAAGARVQVWSLLGRTLLAELTGHTGRIHSIRTADLDGTPVLITASVDSTARLWNLDTLEGLEPPLAEHRGAVQAATIGRFGSQVLVFTGDGEGFVRAWDPASRSEIPVNLPRLQKWVSCLITSELYNKPVLIIGGGDGTLRVCCGDTGMVAFEAQLNTTPQDVVVHPPGDLCVATAMGVVALRIRNWTE